MVAQFNIFKPPDLIQFQVAADMFVYFQCVYFVGEKVYLRIFFTT